MQGRNSSTLPYSFLGTLPCNTLDMVVNKGKIISNGDFFFKTLL